MELTISHLLPIISILIAVGTLLFTAGMHWGYVTQKFRRYDDLCEEVMAHRAAQLAHESDAGMHFSERDWKNLHDNGATTNTRLATMEQSQTVTNTKLALMEQAIGTTNTKLGLMEQAIGRVHDVTMEMKTLIAKVLK